MSKIEIIIVMIGWLGSAILVFSGVYLLLFKWCKPQSHKKEKHTKI